MKQIIKTVLVIVGILLIIGACGNADFADEIGESITIVEMIKPMVWGIGLIICSMLIPSKKGEY